ncbi:MULTISPECIES: hypothetical protein [unclassified Microcoleus]|uniref:hypothetical protein n=1 Tax=unclassified Microcoleus TaxID=2642155 RepID=UPI002FCEEE35
MAAGGVAWLKVKISGFCGLRSIELEAATFHPQIRPAVRMAGIKATSLTKVPNSLLKFSIVDY